MRNIKTSRSAGFSLIELLLATFLFTVIAGVVFSLLSTTQLRYHSESDVMAAFHQANIALDQIVRDVHSAGYPPVNSVSAATAAASPSLVALPFSWSPGYPIMPCTVGVGGNCAVPGQFDLILETNFGQGVQWVRYSLVGTTLMRAVVNKGPGDPFAATGAALVPYVENVINRATPVPVFTYTFDPPAPALPGNIRQVNICLMVRSARPDRQTGQLRVITLTGQAVRFNPNK